MQLHKKTVTQNQIPNYYLIKHKLIIIKVDNSIIDKIIELSTLSNNY